MRCFEQGRYIYWHCPIQNTLRDRDDLQSLAWSTQVITDVKQRPLCKYTLKIAYYENFKNNLSDLTDNSQFTLTFQSDLHSRRQFTFEVLNKNRNKN